MRGGGGAPARRLETDAPIRPPPEVCGARRAQAKHRYALLVKVRREWEVGRRVNSLLDPAKALPGYMGTGRGVVMANGHFQGARPAAQVGGTASAAPRGCGGRRPRAVRAGAAAPAAGPASAPVTACARAAQACCWSA
jgi:hypothetical protein